MVILWMIYSVLTGGYRERFRKRAGGGGGWVVLWAGGLPAADGATTPPQLPGLQRLQRRLLPGGINLLKEQGKCKQARRVSQKIRFHFVFPTYHYLNLLPEIKYMIFTPMLKSVCICIFSNRKFYMYTWRTLFVDETWHIAWLSRVVSHRGWMSTTNE